MAGVVMLFHSRDVADEQDLARRGRGRERTEDGELAQPPRRHDERKSPTHAAAPADHGIAGRAARSPARQRSHRKATPSAARTSRPSLRDSVARPASRPATAKDRGDPLSPRAPSQNVASDERLVEREVVGLDQVHGRQRPGRRRGRRRRARHRPAPGVAGDGPGQRRGDGADERERAAADAQASRRARPDERHLDERRERHPVRVRRDRQHRIGRDRAADLGEDPDRSRR